MNKINEEEGIKSICLNLLTYQYLFNNFNTNESIKLNREDGSENRSLLNKNSKLILTNSEENASSCFKNDFEIVNKVMNTEKSNKKDLKCKEGRKLFKCGFEKCDKRFDYKWILDRHINSHFCFKLYKCDYEGCSKAYKSKENLSLHNRNKHLGEKPYKCNFCPATFSHRNGKLNIKIFT